MEWICSSVLLPFLLDVGIGGEFREPQKRRTPGSSDHEALNFYMKEK